RSRLELKGSTSIRWVTRRDTILVRDILRRQVILCFTAPLLQRRIRLAVTAMVVPVRRTIVDDLHASGVQRGRVDDGVEPAPGSRFLKLRSLKTLAQFVRPPRSLEVEERIAGFE